MEDNLSASAVYSGILIVFVLSGIEAIILCWWAHRSHLPTSQIFLTGCLCFFPIFGFLYAWVYVLSRKYGLNPWKWMGGLSFFNLFLPLMVYLHYGYGNAPPIMYQGLSFISICVLVVFYGNAKEAGRERAEKKPPGHVPPGEWR